MDGEFVASGEDAVVEDCVEDRHCGRGVRSREFIRRLRKLVFEAGG